MFTGGGKMHSQANEKEREKENITIIKREREKSGKG